MSLENFNNMKGPSKVSETGQCGETDPPKNPSKPHSSAASRTQRSSSPSKSSAEGQKDDFPYHSPYLGPLHQVEIPALLVLKPALALQSTVKFNASVQVSQFLELCATAFDDFPSEADVLKGSRGQEERALMLLRDCGGDVTLATYAFLHPCEHLLGVSPPDDLAQRVHQATSEFFMTRQADRDTLAQLLHEAVTRETSEQELSALLVSAKAAKVEVPPEVAESLREAKAVAKAVAKRLATKTVTWGEAEVLESQLSGLRVTTVTSQQMTGFMKSARQWTEKLQECQDQQLTVEHLKALLSEAQTFPFVMPELPELRVRYRKLKKWSEAYATLLRQLHKGEHAGVLEDAIDTVTQLRDAGQVMTDYALVMSHIEACLSWRERVIMVGEDLKETESVLQVLEAGDGLLLEPVELKEVQELEDKLKLWSWEAAVENCLAGQPSLQTLKTLMQEADSTEQRRMPIYRSLTQTLRQAEDWYKNVGNSLSISKLMDLHKTAAANPALSLERQHIKWALEVGSMWVIRAKLFLLQGGTLAELSTLLLEAKSLRASDELEGELVKVKRLTNAWRHEAKEVLRAAANPELAPSPAVRVMKKQLVELEYSLLPKTDNLLEDLLLTLQNASTLCMPSSSVVVAVPHPVKGLAVVFRRHKPLVQTRKHKTARFNKLKRKFLKPKLFSDDKPDFCICRRELSFDGMMVGCDCGEWFHPSCLGLDLKEAGRDGFECRMCTLRYNAEMQMSEAPFELAYFKDLIKRGDSLLVKAPELHSLEVLSRRIVQWIKRANSLLEIKEALVDKASLNDLSYDADLATLLIEQEGLPVKLTASQTLLQLLRSRDWGREACEVLAGGSTKGVKRLLKSTSRTVGEQTAALNYLKEDQAILKEEVKSQQTVAEAAEADLEVLP
jgi:hypothetical protein